MKKILVSLLSFLLIILPSYAAIVDDFVEESLDNNLKIKPYIPTIIDDEFAESNNLKSAPLIPIVISEILPTTDRKICKRIYKISENDENTVKISVKQRLKTNSKLEEGGYVEFKTCEDFRYKGQLYPAGTTVKGRVETFSRKSKCGTPADLVLGNFYITDLPLNGEVSKVGANRTLWVRPLMAVGSAFFGAGYFFIFIKGGEVKIKETEVFELYL